MAGSEHQIHERSQNLGWIVTAGFNDRNHCTGKQQRARPRYEVAEVHVLRVKERADAVCIGREKRARAQSRRIRDTIEPQYS